MPSPALAIAIAAILPPAALAAFLIYLLARYSPYVVRIFEERPMFMPLRADRGGEGEDVTFPGEQGLNLVGTYLPHRAGARAGVIVFCHEFLGDRWSVRPYADHLRDLGFDLFSFDFRNHGSSDHDRVYRPLQWVTDHEIRDIRAALAYLRTRPDRDPAGFGLYGISRGGGAALCVASKDAGVWGVITDGAFPTRGTMMAYILRWAEIYVGSETIWRRLPIWMFGVLGWFARKRSQSRLHCRFPNVERAASRIAPRPWLMIHGGRDAYIGPEIARGLFDEAGDPKELWIVPGAKHNRCREIQPEAYAAKLADFCLRFAPRQPRKPEAVAAAPVDDPTSLEAGSSALALPAAKLEVAVPR